MNSVATLEEQLGLVSDADTARLLGIELVTLRNWRVKGRGPKYVKSAKVVRYRLEDIKAYITTNVIDPNEKTTAPTLSDPRPRRRGPAIQRKEGRAA